MEQGDPSRVPVVLLHAFADSWRSFERVLPHLLRSIQAFAVTQRGHGGRRSPFRGLRGRSVHRGRRGVHGGGRAGGGVIVASSSASLTAQRASLLTIRSERWASCLSARPEASRDKPAAATFIDAVRELSDPIDPAFVREFVAARVSGPVPPACLETIVAENLKVPARVWGATRLVVYGDTGHGTWDMGHAGHWEQPERVAADTVALAAQVRLDRRGHVDGGRSGAVGR